MVTCAVSLHFTDGLELERAERERAERAEKVGATKEGGIGLAAREPVPEPKRVGTLRQLVLATDVLATRLCKLHEERSDKSVS